MAVVDEQPLYMQEGSYSARQDRLVFDSIIDEGVVDPGASSFLVSERALGPNMSVDVSPGRATVVGDDQAEQGTYFVRSTSTESIPIVAADPTNPRIDLVVLKIRDSNVVGGAFDDALLEVIAGTPNVSPVPPAVPDSAIALAQVNVAAGATSIADADIDDARESATIAEAIVRPYIAFTNAAGFGIVGDGSANDTAALNRAWNATPDGGTLVIPQGRYFVDASLAWTGKNVTLSAAGAVIVSTQMTIMTLGGAVTNKTTVSGNIAVGATSFDVASVSGLAVGNLLELRSSGEVFNEERAGQYKGEFVRITSIVGTTIGIEGPTWDSYDATTYTVAVWLIDAKSITVRGLGVEGNGVANQGGLFVQGFDGATIEGCYAKDCKVRGIIAIHGVDGLVSGCVASGSDESTTGYGIHLCDSVGLTARDCHGHGNRHSIDIAGTVPVRNAAIIDCTATNDSSAGISSHGNSDHVTMRGNRVQWCGGGIVWRGSNHTVEGNFVRGCTATAQSYLHAFSGGENNPHTIGNGLAGIGLKLLNNTIDLTGTAWGASVGYGIFVTAKLVDAIISGNTMKGGLKSYGIYLKGNTGRNLTVSKNVVDCSSATSANSYGILYAPGDTTTGNNLKVGFFTDNVVIGDGVNIVQCIRIHGNIDAANPSEDLIVSGNILKGYATSAMLLNVYWGSHVRVEGNLCATGNITTIAYDVTKFVTAPVIVNNTYGTDRFGPVFSGTAAPTTGTWARGDIVFDRNVSGASFIGWVCVAAGTPGTWKTWGATS